MNYGDVWRVRMDGSEEGLEMASNLAAADMMVFAKDYPEVRLVVEVKRALSPEGLDAAVTQIARYMWGANCHYGLIFTPTTTYVLRDDFTTNGPESIRVSDTLATEKLLGRLGMHAAASLVTEYEFARLVREWVELLAASYETALPDDPEVTKALFPEVVGAVADGRVLVEAIR